MDHVRDKIILWKKNLFKKIAINFKEINSRSILGWKTILAEDQQLVKV